MLDVKKAIYQYLPKWLKHSWIEKLVFYLLGKILKQEEINQFLQKNQHKKGFDFIDAILDYFQFSYQASAREVESIPASGRCIIVANHPLGALDGLALMHLVLNIRPDIRIVANEILTSLASLDEYLLPINNLKGESSRSRMTAIIRALDSEMAVIMFPAGEVSRSRGLTVRDKAWGKGFYLLAKRTKADLIPIFISGKNSFWFYAFSKISHALGMLLLPRQMYRQYNKVITLKIGNPLPYTMLNKLPINDDKKVTMLQKHVYQQRKNRKQLFKAPDPIAHPERRSDLRIAINDCEVLVKIRQAHSILLFKPQKNSPLLREIGRLRELTFRQVGEGSQKRRDLDKHDNDYHHLIIWNDEDLEIMGAYRVALAANFFKQESTQNNKLYTQSLFKYQGDLKWVSGGLELGRSFVQPRYWGSRNLDYLWQGIGAYCASHPEIRYLFGTVSISANYPKSAMDYLVAFYRHYYHHPSFEVYSQNPYCLSNERQAYFNDLFETKDNKTAYKEMRLYLREINLVIPILFKHYSELCEDGGIAFTDFGIDPNFNECVDGFVIIDLKMIKKQKYQRYVEPFISKKEDDILEESPHILEEQQKQIDKKQSLNISVTS